MSKFFIEIYLDENVHVLIAKIIQSHGFKATTTHDAGRKGASDAKQLEYANEQGFVILTHDRTDFEELAAEYLSRTKTIAGSLLSRTILLRKSPAGRFRFLTTSRQMK